MEKSRSHIGIIGNGKTNNLNVSEIIKHIQDGNVQSNHTEQNYLGIDLSKYKNSIEIPEEKK